jgi:hypothetical protein
MRLTQNQIQAIKQTADAVLGENSRVILFGSRTDDAKWAAILTFYLKPIMPLATVPPRSEHSMFTNTQTWRHKNRHAIERSRYSRSFCAGDCTTNRHSTMSLKYLPEHAQATLLAVDFARKEGEQLRYSQISPCA